MQSALAGMTAGVLLQLLRRNACATEMAGDRCGREFRPHVPLPRLGLGPGGRTLMLPLGIACGSLLALFAYALLVWTLVGRGESEQRDAFLMGVHPFLFLVPVLAFVALRNSFDALRRRYSPLFAWFGRISLEVRAARR